MRVLEISESDSETFESSVNKSLIEIESDGGKIVDIKYFVLEQTDNDTQYKSPRSFALILYLKEK